MNSSNLKKLLNEYSQKRDFEINNANLRKENIYQEIPRLQEIDTLLSKYAISTAKSLLISNNSNLMNDLNKKIAELKAEKQNIYKSFNINESDFFPKFSCSQCNDTGYTSNGYTTEMCKCLKQKLFDIEYNKYNTYNLQHTSFDKFELSNYSSNIDASKYNSNISPKDNMTQVLDICKKFITNFDDPSEKNLLFTGNTGLGKTFLSTCIANELIKNGKTVLYQTSPIMLDTIINYRLRKKSK